MLRYRFSPHHTMPQVSLTVCLASLLCVGLGAAHPAHASPPAPVDEVLHQFPSGDFFEGCNLTVAGPDHVMGVTNSTRTDVDFWEWREGTGFRSLYNFYQATGIGTPRVAPTAADDGAWYLPIEQDYFNGQRGAPELYFFRWRPDGSGEIFVDLAQTAAEDMYYSSMLVQGPDRRLYGYSETFGPYGLLFAVSLDGVLEVLHRFDRGGKQPNKPTGCGLTLGPDQALYGVTQGGGKYNGGSLYRLSVDGHFSTVHHFVPANPAEWPSPVRSSLALGPDGMFYGVVNKTIYSIRADGTGYKALKTVEDATLQPTTVKVGRDGRLYGAMIQSTGCCTKELVYYRLSKRGVLTVFPVVQAGLTGVVEPSETSLFIFQRLDAAFGGGVLTRTTLP